MGHDIPIAATLVRKACTRLMSGHFLDKRLSKVMHAGEDGKSFLLIDSISSDDF